MKICGTDRRAVIACISANAERSWSTMILRIPETPLRCRYWSARTQNGQDPVLYIVTFDILDSNGGKKQKVAARPGSGCQFSCPPGQPCPCPSSLPEGESSWPSAFPTANARCQTGCAYSNPGRPPSGRGVVVAQ